MNDKSVTLIRPNIGEYHSSDALPPLSIAVLAARTPSNVQVHFYDDRLESLPKVAESSLIAITVETFTARRAYQIATEYRAQGARVVMGGYHPTFLPDEALQYADAVAIGDAEGIWEQILGDHFSGEGLLRVYRADEDRSLNDVVFDHGIFAQKRYPPINLVMFSRGCRFACDFCSIRAFYKQGVRYRPFDSLIAELDALDQKRLTFFVDDNLFVSHEVLHELLEQLTGKGLTWACQISIDVARDDRLLDRMAKAGCALVLIGFESLSPLSLRQMGKRWNKVSGGYRSVVERIHARGIAVYGTFVFGYDGDTIDTMEETLQFALDANLEIANFNPLTPTPGSPLYERFHSEGRLLKPLWWLDPSYRYGDAIFVPQNMDPDAFSKKCFELRSRFYAPASIAKRLIASHKGLNVYRTGVLAIANLISRREIMRKQHRPLGR